MNSCIPCKEKNAPMHYFLTQHTQHRLNQARTKQTYTETEMLVLYNAALKMFTPTPVTVTKTKYIYCSFFPQKLEQVINTTQTSNTAQTPQQIRYPDCQKIRE